MSEAVQERRVEPHASAVERRVQRFDPIDRVLHICLMVSFLGLSLSGLPLLFSEQAWARVMAALMGGYAGSGLIHRFFAFVMIGTFAYHLSRVVRRVVVGREPLLWGARSLVPQPRDLFQMIQHFRWFLYLGPRPRFGRYTYWEKFDYWAVFWGMGIIGGSGLVMWFPQWFSSWLPGWILNVSLLIHGEEAVLAMVFIFTVHFFNGHIRPEKFPMDPVIFTGQVPTDEIRGERPAEYDALMAAGGPPAEPAPPARWAVIGGRTIAIVAIALGWVMVVLTLIGLLA